ncbi:hypothetical protein A1O3_06414 [Capronia epimyces CBS 606.96]|uniref:N-acetyltransferase domain-containing protein n=1 Tax=Capronia epimyces CBS 606.96 TaxID=1182542 RepID=W9Y031_9EURO|nr:uncharacterized protein A1O3_06414 [Capronia epimyces CBS 606.96]EXJ82601.1 hypothetical protein A1O3_06414 [Capronia epimyces CBS 606.96]
MSHIASALQQSRTWVQTRPRTRDGSKTNMNMKFLVSTDASLIPIPQLNKAFASDDMYWATALPETAMREMLDNSLCFGLYYDDDGSTSTSTSETASATASSSATGSASGSASATATATSSSSSKLESDPLVEPEPKPTTLIGFARAITDRVTFFYLTDVYVAPEWQGQGLGGWLIRCVQELAEDMPYLRRTMCIIGHKGDNSPLEFYRKLMKMEPLGVGDKAMVLSWNGPGCVF